MKRAPRSRQRHDLYAKYHDYDSEISDLLGECGIESFRAQARQNADGSGTRYVVTLPKFRNMTVRIPDRKEREAIGEILRDMSVELEVLESRLAKARAVKEGMMQNLLTGRVRLV